MLLLRAYNKNSSHTSYNEVGDDIWHRGSHFCPHKLDSYSYHNNYSYTSPLCHNTSTRLHTHHSTCNKSTASTA